MSFSSYTPTLCIPPCCLHNRMALSPYQALPRKSGSASCSNCSIHRAHWHSSIFQWCTWQRSGKDQAAKRRQRGRGENRVWAVTRLVTWRWRGRRWRGQEQAGAATGRTLPPPDSWGSRQRRCSTFGSLCTCPAGVFYSKRRIWGRPCTSARSGNPIGASHSGLHRRQHRRQRARCQRRRGRRRCSSRLLRATSTRGRTCTCRRFSQ